MEKLFRTESCLLGVALLLGFTVYHTSSQVQLSDSQGCNGGDELIRGEDLNQYSASGGFGLFISTSHPIQCSGRVTMVETCGYVQVYNETLTSTAFRMRAYLLRYQQSERKYVQVGLSQSVKIIPADGTQTYCHTQEILSSNNWTAQVGDIFGVYILSQCVDRGTIYRCPAQPVITPTHTNQTGFPILYYNTSALSPTDTIDLQAHLLSTSHAIVNIRATIEAKAGKPIKDDHNYYLTLTTSLVVFGMIVILIICALAILIKRHREKVKDREIIALSSRNDVIKPVGIREVQINKRGMLRRSTRLHSISSCTPSTSTTRSRRVSLPNDYSRDVQGQRELSTLMDSPIQSREIELNSKALSNYEVGFGDYAAPVFSPSNKLEELTQQLETIGVIEVPKEQLVFEEELGSGQFGTVYKALWTYPESLIPQDGILNLPKVAQVAVKVMEGEKTEDRIKFLQEAVLLGQFNDPNIVAIFGAVTMSTRVMMICELMDSDLRNELHTCRNKLENEMRSVEVYHTELPAMLLSYSRKIASSMVYLGMKGFVHRDLAARNILVSNEGDCKISDFGMSRDLQDETYYTSHEGMIPVKWTAPEAVKHRKYSFKSDVWSYGILLYEIWSLGYKPYHDMSNMEVVARVETGYRLPPPPGCPRSIYNLMIKCTHPETEARPTFTQVLVDLQRPDYQLLKWTTEDVRTDSEAARILGAPLKEGFCLYKDLQNTYLGPRSETSL